jgi:hypothetical protein
LEKITVVVTVAVLGVALAVSVRATAAVPLLAALVVTACAGMDLVLRGETRYHPTLDLFILPVALVVGTVLFLPLLPSGAAIVVGLAGFGVLLFAAFWAEHALRVDQIGLTAGEALLTVIGYVAAFLLYASIYQLKTRSVVSAPAIVLVTFLLAARQLRIAQLISTGGASGTPAITDRFPALTPAGAGAAATVAAGRATTETIPLLAPMAGIPAPATTAPTESSSFRVIAPPRGHAMAPGWPRVLVYSAVIALASGEITWALNYWPLNGLFGGAFLLACYYFLAGTLSLHLQSRLTTRLLAEFAAVASGGSVLVAVAGLLRRPT